MNTYTLLWALIFINILPISAQQTLPSPKSGKSGLKELIKTHFDYPENDFNIGIEGTVIIEFTTNPEGEVINYSISQSVSKSIDSAAINLFRKILWDPGTNLGIPVASSSEFKLKFSKKGFNKLAKRRGYNHIAPSNLALDTSFIVYDTKNIDTIPTPVLDNKYKNINDFIYNNLKYPEAAFKLGLSGNVGLKFIVETNGLPSNFIIEEHLGGGCTEEAIEIIDKIKWNPGIKKGKAVRTYYRLSIKFNKPENRDNYIPNQQGSGI